MNITLLTDKGLDDLKNYCLQTPSVYQVGGIPLQNYGSFEYPDIVIDGPYPMLADQSDDVPLWKTDYLNSLTIFRFFGSNAVPLSLMNDERYMAHLAHFEYFEYMKKRWPIEDDHIEGRIKSQYFFNRAPYARHGILRLFWPAYLVAQANRENTKEVFEEKLACFFRNRIAFDRVLERNFSRNYFLLDCCIEAVLALDDESAITAKKRSGFLGKNINNMLSVTSLDSMSKSEAASMIKKLVDDIASGVYDSEDDPGDDEDE